jgi:hypothetical protein
LNSRHIPYRDSKLTRILQPALGGNSKTSIICTVTPASRFIEESISTLKFASRAKTIQNKPQLNEVKITIMPIMCTDNLILLQIVSDEALLKQYKKEIGLLKKQLDDLRENQFVPRDYSARDSIGSTDSNYILEKLELFKNAILTSKKMNVSKAKVCQFLLQFPKL